MDNFTFHNPTKIIFGKNETFKIGKVTKKYGSKILLVYGQSSCKKSGVLDKVLKSLEKESIISLHAEGVKSNPTLSFVRDKVSLFKKNKLDAIVALGGGSVIDTAKAIAAGAKYDGDVWDFFIGKATVTDAIPITVVLTLAASASEMNSGSVITNEETNQKFNLNGTSLFPKVSILDPINTLTVPMEYSMYGAIDACSHIMEGYFNTTSDNTPIQDHLCESLIKVIMDSANEIFQNPNNYSARANLMWAATLGFNGLPVAGVSPTGFPMHMVEHSLSALYNIAHGAGLAIIIPAWMKYASHETSKTLNSKRYNRITKFCDNIFKTSSHKNGISNFQSWCKSKNIATTLTDSGIDPTPRELDKIATNALMLSKKWHLDQEYSVDIITKILQYAI